MSDSMTQQNGYTPMGFKTKAVKEQMAKNEVALSVSDKVNVITQMTQLGNVIISPQFQQYTPQERVDMLNQFAQLQATANSFN